ncbi:MAG: hypothetical protein HY327_06700 [Chloroflexi bacterium]|nr:hypothetical protein [Chloroflexota bacterium]
MVRTLTRKRQKTRMVGEMTTDELQIMLESLLDRKLKEISLDPDEGLELHPEIAESILRQEKEYAAGKRGKPLAQVVEELGLE